MNYNSLIKDQAYLFESEKDLFSENNEFIYNLFLQPLIGTENKNN
jgi:uncharacterized protein YcgL (UPF0745 family)